MGIPVIVGTEVATKQLKENQIITVDATHGKVYDGRVEIKKKQLLSRLLQEQRQLKQ